MPSSSLEMDFVARFRRWRRSLVLLVLLVLGGLGMAFGAWKASLGLALSQTREDAQRHLRFVAHELIGALSKYEAIPQLLARHPALAELLVRPDSLVQRTVVNTLLEDVARDSNAAAIFLIDARGLTLAASNWREAQGFVGQNCAFRPYFQDAMIRGSGRFYARGSTTRAPGYFIAHRLSGAAPGVIVLKASLDEMEANWARGAGNLMLADSRGVVFLASRPEWKYRTLRPLSDANRAELADTRQYGDLPLTPLDRAYIDLGSGLRVERIDTEKSRLAALVDELPIEGHGWTLLSVTEIREAQQIAAGRAWAAALGWVSLLLLLAYLQLRRRRAQERQVAQGELRAAHDSLEIRIAQRTQELQNRVDELHRTEVALRATQEHLVQAGKLTVLGQLAASITHEINQPLAALRALNDNARVFLERGMTADAESNLVAVDGLTQRIAAIVSQLRGFARRDELRVQPVLVDSAFQASVALVGAEARRRGVKLECLAPPENLHVLGQQVRIEQVLVNLLRNGIDASAEAGGGRVVLRAEIDAEGGQARLRVSDDGAGLSAEVQSRLFEPFFTTKRRGDGLGLGLSISASIANALGGSLQAANGANGGAQFTLCLPIAQPKHASD